MKAKPFRWVSSAIVAGIFYLLVGMGRADTTGSLPQILSFETNQGHTEILFHLPSSVHLKLLNPSPAQKLLVKIYSSNLNRTFRPYFKISVPEPSGIASIQQLPLKKNSRLLVFTLKSNLNFSLHQGNPTRIILHDEAFFDPLEQLYQQAVALQKAGQLDKALTLYRKIIFKNRRHGNAYFKAGQIRFAKKQYHLAEINFKHALRLKCDSLGLYRDMARLYRVLGNSVLARKYQRLYQEQYSRQPQPVPDSQKQVSAVEASSPAGSENPVKTSPPSMEENAAPSQLTRATDSSVVSTSRLPEKPARSANHILLYLLGTALLLGVLLYWLITSIQKRMVQRLKTTTFPELNLEKNREKILQTAQAALQQAAQREEQMAEMPPKPEPPAEPSGLREPAKASPPPVEEEMASVLTEDSPAQLSQLNLEEPENRLKLARSLNLGVGELELALNLKAHQRNVHKNLSREEQIARLYQKNLNVAEIARRMKIGQGEVEFYLAMQKQLGKSGTQNR